MKEKSEAFIPKNTITTHTGGSIMLCGYFTGKDTGALQKIDGIVRKEDYLHYMAKTMWTSLLVIELKGTGTAIK